MEQRLLQRAKRYLQRTFLGFTCYRIRRRWSLPLPVMALPELDTQVRGFAQPYPWQIWCLWALEERLYALSGAGLFLDDQLARDRCIEDLEALAQWPRYTVANRLDLPYGHAVQLMAMALRDWTWLPEATQQALRSALQRSVEEGLALVPSAVQALASSDELLAKPSPHQHLHNIPLIAQAALASAAEVINHPESERLSSRFLHLFQARLALYHQGLTEGISYDGYLYNFALGWLSTQSSAVIESIAHHPAMQDLEDQARGLACPGQVAQSAEIGDVEPLEMPFVWSALARLQQWAFSDARETLLDAVPAEWLRADALWVRAQQADQQAAREDTTLSTSLKVVQQSTAALTLATGLGADDLSVVMSFCCSPMNHIQADSGTLLIGHAGHWWITDPGYQQYLKTAERDFTLGPEAHNTPVINGNGQVHKAGRLLYSGECQLSSETEGTYAVVDLTACYPVEAQAETVTRTLWRLGRDQVVVCDTVVAAPDVSVAYHWHGDADAYWGEQAGMVTLYLPSNHRPLWIQSGQQPLGLAQQHRLRGSRGQCTLQVTQPPSVTHHWWSFSFTDTPSELQASVAEAQVGEIHLRLADLLPKELPSPGLEVTVHRDYLQVALCRGDELLAPPMDSGWDVSLSINGKIAQALSSSGRQWVLPVPAITPDDTVLIAARLSKAETAASEIIEYFLTASDKAAICSVPLRVYTEVDTDQVTGRCALMPGVMEGKAEYAFYLLVEGQRSQVRWYEATATHTFTLTPEEMGKPVQVRVFVRAAASPKQKLSAVSLSLNTDPVLEPISAMPESHNDNAGKTLSADLNAFEKRLLQASKDSASKVTRDLITVQNRLYAQLESLSWLQRRLKIQGRLPPLRGWATSPDVLLHLHEHVMAARPRLVVEFGSGASSLVIADALRQNGFGKLVSLDHSEHYGGMTRESLRREYLDQWVDLRIGELEPWTGQHLGRQEGQEDEALHWYPVRLLEGLEGIDMVLVDGPPGATCQYARYPALPALVERLSAEATVWMDDTIRQDEKDICEDWAQRYGMTTEYLAYEKGLGILRRSANVA
ncbi:heparinase II/III domain-containing protein [Chromohalobacter japonicus]|uniref:heparinase II/III domain-containing protein n=1 Tax=Chromohalobacter japonicus TaxID=223900 RepID=UPI001FF2C176|nr:heparinase II/III family protein [Chromohalobacter japonicus]MCK0753256.1 heparinase II/III family protein [Chromohalobacter japonicus]